MVADDYDDWDKDDSPKMNNQGGVNQRDGMAFFNRAPLNVAGEAKAKPSQARQVPK